MHICHALVTEVLTWQAQCRRPLNLGRLSNNTKIVDEYTLTIKLTAVFSLHLMVCQQRFKKAKDKISLTGHPPQSVGLLEFYNETESV